MFKPILFQMLSISWGSSTELKINLRDAYLAGEPIVIEITAQNNSDDVVDIPDLGHETWRSSFTISGSKLPLQKRKNSIKDTQSRWKIPPRGARKTQLALPGGKALSPGKYSLSVNIDAESETLQEKIDIELQKAKPVNVNLLNRGALKTHAIWLQKSLEGYDLYFNNGQWNTYVERLSEAVHPKLSVCNKCEKKAVWQKDRSIYWLDKKGAVRKIQVPWPSVELIGRAAYNGEYHVPIWAQKPKSKNGDLWLMRIDRRGQPHYHKMRSAMGKPLQISAAVTEQGNPLFLLRDDQRVELYSEAISQNRTLPLLVKRIRRIAKNEKLLDVRFGIHPEKGLTAWLTLANSNLVKGEWRTLGGKEIGKPLNIALNSPDEIVHVNAKPNFVSWLTRKDGKLWVIHPEKNRELQILGESVLNKDNGVTVFTENADWKQYKID